jgi:hypothetical protein
MMQARNRGEVLVGIAWSPIEFQLAFLRIVFKEPALEGMPEIAANMIAAGYSTPSLDELAGLSNTADTQTVSTLVAGAGGELGYQRLEGADNRLAAGRLYLELIVVGVLSPCEGSRSIWKTIYWNLPDEAQWGFSPFVGLASDWEDMPARRPELDAAILEAARGQLAALDK